MREPYCGLWQADLTWYQQWNVDPAAWALLACAALGACLGRGDLRATRLAALGVAALLWLSPLCPLSATLLSARTGHHVAVMLAFAPLAARAWPVAPRFLPVAVAGLLSAAVMAAWYVPALYALQWRSDLAYALLQAAMAGAAWQLWLGWSRASVGREHEAIPAVAALALLALAMGLLAALLTFAPRVLLVEHLMAAPRLGLDALGDQRIAGLAMWTLGMAPLAAVVALSLRGRFARMVAG